MDSLIDKKYTIEQHEIFKYCSYDTALKIIITQQLKFTCPLNFNDPLDCDIDILYFDFSKATDGIKKEAIPVFLHEYKNIHPDAKLSDNEIINQNQSNIEEAYKHLQIEKIKKSSVCCFSLACDNTLMWSHYGDSHNGVCFEFDLEEYNGKIFDAQKSVILGKVDYSRNERINYFENKQNAIKKLFLSKNKDWGYEQEARIVTLDPVCDFGFKLNSLKSVIFGYRVNEKQRLEFIKLCEMFGFRIKYRRVTKELFNIKVEDLK